MTIGRILVVGEALTAFHHFPSDERFAFHGPFPSGAPVIFASAAARLGAEVHLATGIGDDVFGEQFRAYFERDGIRPEGVAVHPTLPTSSAFVSYQADGSRKYIFYFDATAALAIPVSTLDHAGSVDWLHVSGATLTFGGDAARTCWAAVERALASGTPISFDPNVRADRLAPDTARQVDTLLRTARVVLVSVGEIEALGASEAAIVGRGATVCYKAGAAGATVVTPYGREHVAAPAVIEVDPDGAGDIFAAGYVVSILAGASPRDAARVAVRVASDSVTVRGPLESFIRPLEQYAASPS